jgi:3,4-dihydroxy 2-butanone 4-phosphate synthase/GTP cyclohydrolase II
MIAKTSEALKFDTVEDVVSDIAKGKLVIVTDDADRENEGDQLHGDAWAIADGIEIH